MARILLADDHDLIRKGVRALFDDDPDLEPAGEARTVPEVLRMVREESWDLLVMDLGMPGGEGLETLQRVGTAAPDLPVIILSMHPEDQLARRLLRAGARGYVQKSAAAENLVVAVRRVLAGGRYVSPELASALAADLGGEGAEVPHQVLSDREFQVLCMLASGKSLTDIAAELSLSVKTVSTYKTRLLEKMQMESTADLVRYALEHDLVQ